MKIEDIRKGKASKTGLLHQNLPIVEGTTSTGWTAFYNYPNLTIGVHVRINDEFYGKYWRDKKEVLAYAFINGYQYRCGLDKFKSERSLVLRLNNFAKLVLNDQHQEPNENKG